MPRVSVVVPTYNRAADVARCLDSLVQQTFKDFEVLVCDDGSTDNTAEVANRYTDKLDLTYHWAENFGGPARPRNIGVGLARGQYVAFLDSDDWWAPRKLEESVKYLERGAALVHHDLYLATRADRRRFWRKSRSRVLRSPVFEDLIARGNGINNSSVVMTRDVLQAIGGFAEDRALVAAEDYDAWLRAAKVTEAFVRIPQTLGYYWIGSGNLTNPARTLTLLEALQGRYARDFAALAGRRGIVWPAYLKARSHYLLGAYGEALASLAALRWREAPLSIQVKSLWMLIVIRFRHRGGECSA